MNRKSRWAGAVLLALLLTAFVGVGSASAAAFEIPGSGPHSSSIWSGEIVGKAHHMTFPGSSNSLTCGTSTLSGETQGENPSELTASATLSCAFTGYNTAWQMHGCKYRFHTEGTFDITGCESPMTWSPGSICTISIGNQSGRGSVTYSTSESESQKIVTVKANLSGITYTVSGHSFQGCGEVGTHSDGTYTGEWQVRPPRFRAETYPAKVKASALGKILTFPSLGGNLSSCHLSMEGMVSAAAEEVIFGNTSFTECALLGAPATVYMDGCHFDVTASGNLGIAGSLCAEYPMIIEGAYEEGVNNGPCTVTVGPTGRLAAFTPTNEGTGSSRKVKLTGRVLENVFSYTAEGAGCPATGTFTDGRRLATSMTLTAERQFESVANGLWFE